MHVTTSVFLLRVIDVLMKVSLQCSIAARRVRIESTARLDGEVGGLLRCLDGKIPHALYHHSPLATDPRDNRWPVFVMVAPTRFTLLAPLPGSATQQFLPAVGCLALPAGCMIEFVGFDRALYVAIRLVGDSRMAQPPAPAIAGADMDAQFSGDATR
jgi:hypothetical protein